MSLAKSYKLINFLNHERGAFTRTFLAVGAWVGAFICSFNLKLAFQLFREFKHGDLKAAFRRASWIANRSWLKFSLLSDPYFIFSENLTLDEVEIYIEFLHARKQSMNKQSYQCDYLMLLGQKIHLLVECMQMQELAVEQHPALSFIKEFLALKEELINSPVPKENKQIINTKNSSREGDFSKQDALLALQDFAQLFPLNSYPWYVISGTFLGLYRDGGFMPHDYDIDVGINYEMINFEQLEKILDRQKIFAVKKIDYNIEVTQIRKQLIIQRKPALIKLIHHTGINIDIFIHHLDGDIRWHGSSIHRWDNKEFELEHNTLEGVDVLQPTNADQYLTENYGDWRTPVKSFNCSTGTPNLTITHNFLSHALFIKRMLYHCEAGIDYNLEVKKQLIKNAPIKVIE